MATSDESEPRSLVPSCPGRPAKFPHGERCLRRLSRLRGEALSGLIATDVVGAPWTVCGVIGLVFASRRRTIEKRRFLS